MRTVLLALACSAGFAAGPKPFTLEQILSSAFPTDLTPSARGGKFAWVLDARGARNIWVAEGPEYRGRQVTSYSADDGQEISRLDWTPDARAIVYVRGGAANRGGEIPNPTSDPKGAEQAVWVISASGGEPRRLGEGGAPEVSPKGDRVAFLSKGQLWWAPLDGSEKASQLARARGQANSLRWSPDGGRIAFSSSRGDHGFIGVYDLAAKSVRFLDPSVDTDMFPVWSPDGRSIAFARIPASRERTIFGPKREAEPWSIRVADVATGHSRLVWKAEPGRGSAFHGVEAESQILWTSGDRLIFPWERDGWNHLYSASAASEGPAVLLTPGTFEVENVRLVPDGRSILFTSNQDDIDRRHIWRVPAAGGAVAAVTRGTGIEWAPALSSDGKALAYLASGGRAPAHAMVAVESAPPRDLAPEAIPAGFPSDSIIEPQPVIIDAADGMKIHTQLFLPAGIKPGERRPAAIFFHGGSRRQMLLGWHYSSYYHNAYAMSQYLASHGYIALAVNYRSGIGYGMEFREALNFGATGASELQDVLGAGLYLRGRADIDPKRIALWGGSYGGYLTAMGLSRASDLFACGVDIHGVHDWNVVTRNFIPSYDPLAQQAAAKLAFDSSPMASIKTWRSPVLLIHGDDDRNVPFSESVTLAEALRQQGVEFEQLIFPDEVHSFLRHASWVSAFEAAADFLDRKLGRK